MAGRWDEKKSGEIKVSCKLEREYFIAEVKSSWDSGEMRCRVERL